ncbi:MAG: hypothetical protein HYT70_03315 [Candidatus Aenigmarchaeota archaeon]|nr:hypothetical protein [Candidatus Aenigmarchaeota archaeon]
MVTELQYPTRNLIVYDTSFLVNYGRHDLGTFAALNNLDQMLDSDGGYTEIIPNSVISEYERFCREKTVDEEGLPKYHSLTLFRATNPEKIINEIPEGVVAPRERTTSEELWSKTAPKAFLGRSTRLMAQRGHHCYVFTYDSDIANPCSSMHYSEGLVSVMDYDNTEYPVPTSELKNQNWEGLAFLREPFSKLFSIPQKKLGYLTCARVKLFGHSVDVGLHVGDSITGMPLQDGQIRRLPLTVFDMEGMPDIAKTGVTPEISQIMEDILYKRTQPFLNYLVSAYAHCSYLQVARSREHAYLAIDETSLDRKFRSRSFASTPEAYARSYCFLDEHYMVGHHPEVFGVIEHIARQYK